ncbi:hypothetical protein SERLADRAFT_461828 [Serpula lacrymans var. lacrymans S7.9]|nr:uncharacterized protein SERLADRAFT_461828 [Serpula lacrymans var. lacrymans S7.9]EGO27775.1 hypothetical protein SERLADRAFT_461828 [Serpula lacrymans var. lacrymans S7.9]
MFIVHRRHSHNTASDVYDDMEYLEKNREPGLGGAGDFGHGRESGGNEHEEGGEWEVYEDEDDGEGAEYVVQDDPRFPPDAHLRRNFSAVASAQPPQPAYYQQQQQQQMQMQQAYASQQQAYPQQRYAGQQAYPSQQGYSQQAYAGQQAYQGQQAYAGQQVYPQQAYAGQQAVYSPHDHGIEYPPGMAYTDADLHGGNDGYFAPQRETGQPFVVEPEPEKEASSVPAALRPSVKPALSVGAGSGGQSLTSPSSSLSPISTNGAGDAKGHLSFDSFYGGVVEG